MKCGFLRETKEEAIKCGIHKKSGLNRTGLDEYLLMIFPNISSDKWIHYKPFGYINNKYCRKRPDYRCDELKLIVEYDGTPHYQNPDVIKNDSENIKFYENLGYKVVRIPYFIQLTNKAIKTLFDVDMDETMFPENIPSFDSDDRSAPSYCCISGIKRMANDFKKFPEQYNLNLNYLKSIGDETDWKYLDKFYNEL